MDATPKHFDVVIVGAGLSGIGAAIQLQKRCPGKSFAILEARACSGGTWDLFRYPGVRSDSDMYTLGYAMRPWRDAKAIADGATILDYIRSAASETGVAGHIRFGHSVGEAAWSSETARWTVTAAKDGAPVRLTCSFLWMCSGYYSYEAGHRPAFSGEELFQGRILHPQEWPQDLDFKDKRVVVIGSGATAVTLIPAMAKDARHVTMLQRSPTYMFSMPSEKALAKALQRLLPKAAAFWIVRWYQIFFQHVTYRLSRKSPEKAKSKLIKLAREKLPADYDVDTHFTPRYFPWEQRLCLVPDDDLFEAIGSGKASVETGEIETFVEDGVRLNSGRALKADIIVTATGLSLKLFGGARLTVDGEPVELGDKLTYKGVMLSGVPNMAMTFGYLNASWTLRADLIGEYVCRLINTMDKKGWAAATPVLREDLPRSEVFAEFSSGYLARASEMLPKQGPRAPWRQPQNYFLEIWRLRHGAIADGVIKFTGAPQKETDQTEQPLSVAAE